MTKRQTRYRSFVGDGPKLIRRVVSLVLVIGAAAAAQRTEDAPVLIGEAGKGAVIQQTAADSGEVEVVVTVGTDNLEVVYAEVEVHGTINDSPVSVTEVVIVGMITPRTSTDGLTWGELKRLLTLTQSDR